MKKKVSFIIAIVFATATMLFAICGIKKNLFDDAKADRKSVSITPKVAMAKACNKDKTNCIENVMLLSGAITDLTADEISNFLRSHSERDISAICFNSPGGSVWVAETIALMILELGKPTCLAETYFFDDNQGRSRQQVKVFCHSACNYLLLSSSQRIALGTQFKFESHSAGFSASFCFCETPITMSFMNGFIFEDILGREDNVDRKEHLAFLAMSNEIDFSDSYQLSLQELQHYKIFSEWK